MCFRNDISNPGTIKHERKNVDVPEEVKIDSTASTPRSKQSEIVTVKIAKRAETSTDIDTAKMITGNTT